MRQIIVEIDDATAERLERVAPSRARKRSEFIRAAIRRALDELAEREMAEAYRRHPDPEGEVYVDHAVWEPRRRVRRRR
jgi:Arc/MetJ-type ribon-helix-helix transcriptional regulator